MPDFPPHMPNTGEKVPKDPADLIRDVFLANGGRLTVSQTETLIGRHSFTYGQEIHDTWQRLLDQGMWERDGDDYANRFQEYCSRPPATTRKAQRA